MLREERRMWKREKEGNELATAVSGESFLSGRTDWVGSLFREEKRREKDEEEREGRKRISHGA